MRVPRLAMKGAKLRGLLAPASLVVIEILDFKPEVEIHRVESVVAAGRIRRRQVLEDVVVREVNVSARRSQSSSSFSDPVALPRNFGCQFGGTLLYDR